MQPSMLEQNTGPLLLAPLKDDARTAHRDPRECAASLRRRVGALVESQDGACDFAGFHRAEGFVDVAKMAALGHHVVEVEAALAVKIEIERDVVAEAVRAHPRGLHLALRSDRHPWELDH